MFLSRVHFKKDTLFELARIALPMVVSQGTFAVITPALIVGAFAERMKFSAFLIFSVLWSIFIYSH